MHRLRTWTRGHIEVLRAWQRHAVRHCAEGPRLTAIYTHLKTFPLAQQTQWRRRCKATLWGVALCLAASGAQLAHADTITVDGTCTLVDAITAANTDTATGSCSTGSGADTIVLTVDTALTTSNNNTFGPTGLPVVSSVITIAGNGKTIARTGGPGFRLLAINSTGDLTLQDTTVSGGIAAGTAPLDDGGGIANYFGQLRLEGCTVSGNSAGDDGGGVLSYTNGSDTLSFVNTTLSGNTAASGGGVFSVTLGSSTVSLVNSTLSGNSAASGGGVYSATNDTSTVSFVNTTVSGNAVDGNGGGVYSVSGDTSTVSFVNTTVSGNTTGGNGGGVYSVTFGSSTVALHRSLIAGNTATASGDEVRQNTIAGSFLVNDYNLFGHSGITTAAALAGVAAGASDIVATSDGTNVALADILDLTLANNGGPTFTHNLVTDSPAIDAAGACGLATDQRGAPRPFDGDGAEGAACDIGAVEFNSLVPGSDPCDSATPTLGCTVNGVLNQPCQGGPGKDVIVGTSGNDVIVGGAGNDELRGGPGVDLLCGQEGNDLLFGHNGNDDLYGGGGKDVLRGENGDDLLDGGDENDTLLGGPNNDDLVGGDDTDLLKGDAGTDMCDGETEVTCEL